MKLFDFIILSGGHTFPLIEHEKELSKEIEFVRACQKPLLGICFGFELIARAFGATLKQLRFKRKDIVEIVIVEPDPVF